MEDFYYTEDYAKITNYFIKKYKNIMYLTQILDYDDFRSICNVGLVKATNSYDDTRGVKFESHLFTCIDNEFLMIYRHLQTPSYKENYMYADDVKNRITMEEIDLSIFDLLSVNNREVDDIIDTMATYEVVEQYLNSLPQRDRTIFRLHMQGKTQNEIRDLLSYSQSSICLKIKKHKLLLENIL